MQEPLEAYLEAFDAYRATVEDLLEKTVDLSQIEDAAVEVLTDPAMLYAVRYLAGPPISKDDLEVLAEASLAPTRLRDEPDMARRVIETVLIGLDRNRFPWITEDREPTDAEREAAAMASAAMIASRRVMTDRANESKTAQEKAVADRLLAADFTEVPTREITNWMDVPAPGAFCGESLFAGRKADLVVRLWDGRVMPTECKVSSSQTNSVKRLNNDAAVKAGRWIRDFGAVQTVPAAVLSGVYGLHNLEDAQNSNLTLFWAHNLEPMIDFIESTRR
ncbi:MAG: XamI family restriction endonuclease [Actinomycetota bacterium]|nr:XamI family restriction endonuclease [Actinomycetota bacterium]